MVSCAATARTSPARIRADVFQLLRTNRDLRLVFAAQVISFMGDWFSYVALAGLVDDATGSELLVALIFVAFTLPSFLLSPVAGPVADRFDRRSVLVIVSGAQAAAAAGLLLTGDGGRIWAAFVFQGAIAGLAAFVKPAVEAGVPNLARDEGELRTATSMLGSTWGVMLAVGASIGGAFSELFGRRASFVANALTFVAAGILFWMVRRPMQSSDRPAEIAPVRPVRDMREAFALARHDRVLLALMTSKATFGLGAGTVSLLAVLASDVFHSGDAGRGLLLGARGLGSGLGPLIAARFTRGDLSRVLRVCGVAGLGFAICYMGVAAAPHIAVALLLVALAHLGGGAQWTLSTFGLQLRAPDAVRGRVLAGDFAIVTLVLSLSSVAAGALGEWAGVRATIAVFAILAAVAGTTYLIATSRLRLRAMAAAPTS